MARSRSLPPKPSSPKPVKCMFYHGRGNCVWGSFCKFEHDPPRRKYAEKITRPNPFFNTPISLDLGNGQRPVPLYTVRLEHFHRELRREAIKAYMAERRDAMLSALQQLEPPPKIKLVQAKLDGWVTRTSTSPLVPAP
jgi:hypothetical protein